MSFSGFKNYPDISTPLDDSFLNGLLDLLMPIGKTEIFYDNEDHSNYMGFTWERTAIGKVPVGINTSDTDFNTIGKTGGEKTHNLTADEIPSIDKNGNTLKYNQYYAPINNYGASTSRPVAQFEDGGNSYGGQPHNNLQPYEVMAFWKRVA